MNTRRHSSRFFILLVLVGILLTLLPMPSTLQAFRPPWLSLFLIYWSLEGPRPIALGRAFFLGLFIDILTGSLIGLHAFQWVVLAFLVARFSSRIRFSVPVKQALTVLLLLLNERFILLWVLLLTGESAQGFGLWMPAVMGAFIWPWLFVLLSRLRQVGARH